MKLTQSKPQNKESNVVQRSPELPRRMKLALIAVSALCCGLLGFLLGSANAPSRTEWRQERASAKQTSFRDSKQLALRRSRLVGLRAGKKAGQRDGRAAGGVKGGEIGKEGASTQLVEAEAERDAELTYTEQLPNGDPGYILPSEERSTACIGISAETGECVGD
jgi:hypothetical protein